MGCQISNGLSNQQRVEGIHKMLDALHLMAYPYHDNNIKAKLSIHLLLLDISIGGHCQITHLLSINGFLGLLVFFTRAGLYLYHNQSLSIRRNGKDIQIALAVFPVSVDDDIAFILEIERSLVFSPFA